MIAVALSLALVSGASSSSDGHARARQFLEAFAADPVTAKQFVTKDAVIAVGDIGGTYDDSVKVIRSKAPDWLNGCQIGGLLESPSPTAEELRDSPPRYHGGKLSVFEGSYSCPRQDGSMSDVQFIVVMRDDRIVDLYIGGPR